MKKIFIKNRKEQRIAIIVDVISNQKGLAFVMHGLGGFKEQPHVKTFAKAFQECGYTTVRFDTTNSYGESDGNFEDATTTNYFEDLEDVIEWSKSQSWYQEPFCLVGHSLGGISVALYAQKNPQVIKALAPIATVISGKISIDKHDDVDYKSWEKTGIREWESSTKPGFIKRLKWSHVEDRMKYDLLPKAHKLTMPVLLIVGEEDFPENQKILYDALPGKKEIHIIKNAPHTFVDKEHLEQIHSIMKEWIMNQVG